MREASDCGVHMCGACTHAHAHAHATHATHTHARVRSLARTHARTHAHAHTHTHTPKHTPPIPHTHRTHTHTHTAHTHTRARARALPLYGLCRRCALSRCAVAVAARVEYAGSCGWTFARRMACGTACAAHSIRTRAALLAMPRLRAQRTTLRAITFLVGSTRVRSAVNTPSQV